MKKIHVFTSAALNYVPKVRMLYESLRTHHPEFVLHLALADHAPAAKALAGEPFDHLIALDELEIPAWRGWSFCHRIVELATAIKPFVLARLLARPDCGAVLYMDPDTVAFSRLDDIVAALQECSILLTPHQTVPETTLAAVMDNEICSLKHGVYNLGFIGVAADATGARFAEWWSRRVYHFCRADIPNGLFTDQRWIDLVPAFFDGVAIMRSSRHNVAPWNLTTRTVSRAGDGTYTVDGEPLGFYHFTGFDSGAHALMATKNSAGDATVRDLVRWYEERTRVAATDLLAAAPWGFGAFSNGEPIIDAQRLVYRERVDLQRAFPDPYDAGGYLPWWNAQGRIEYPALFDPLTRDAAAAAIGAVLSAGFHADDENLDWSRTRARLAQAMSSPATGAALVRRGWRILRTEGLPGIRKRLNG